MSCSWRPAFPVVDGSIHGAVKRAEIEAGRRVQEDTLKALGESKEFKEYDEEVTLQLDAVRAGYGTGGALEHSHCLWVWERSNSLGVHVRRYAVGDEPLTTQRITQMQAHVQTTLNHVMEKHADKVG